MTTARPNWTARLAGGLLLLLTGAALATWGLARSAPTARLFGVAPTSAPPVRIVEAPAAAPLAAPVQADARLAAVEGRLAAVENATQRAQGSAGRADALLVAFAAARRAVDRGLALGYLEPLLIERFGSGHEQAVATIVTAARQPIRLDALIDEYGALGDSLRSPGPDEGWWTGVRREMGSLISVHRADVPSVRPQARFDRAFARLQRGEVDGALTETMRLPGVARANDWVVKARRFIAVHRALDEIETAALLPNAIPPSAPPPAVPAPAAPVTP